MTVHCPDCNNEIVHTAKVCPRCGSTKSWHWEALAARKAVSRAVSTATGPSAATNTSSDRVIMIGCAVLLFGVLVGIGLSMQGPDNSATVVQKPSALVWSKGHDLGKELGKYSANEGLAFPPALDAIARTRSAQTNFTGIDQAEWERGFRDGYLVGYHSVKK